MFGMRVLGLERAWGECGLSIRSTGNGRGNMGDGCCDTQRGKDGYEGHVNGAC